MSRAREAMEDSELLAAVARDADRTAFAVLFRRYAPRLRGFLSRGSLPEGQVDELVQEVMLEAWYKADRYDPSRAAVSTWLFTIARNRHVDRVRKHARAVPESHEPASSTAATPADIAQADERARSLWAALTQLPDEQRTAITQVFFHHRTHAEAASHTHIAIGTQKSRVRAALKALRAKLEGEEP